LKIGIICFWDRLSTPYLEKYERTFKECSVDYDIVFWNRTEPNNLAPKEKNEININIKILPNKLLKVFLFIRWKKKIISILKKNKYDGLIVLTTYPGILLYRFLIKNYSNKFILDIRDYTSESIPIYKRLVTKMITQSAFTTISSKGFWDWLDRSEKIIINHNLNYYNIKWKKTDYFTNHKIKIGFVGTIRLYGQTIAVLMNMKDSDKYIFGFIGRMMPECNLKKLCEREKITNYEIKGEFPDSYKSEVYQDIDLINSIYDNDTLIVKTALPNKIYDAATFRIPIVASKGTFLAEIINKYNLGFSVDGYDKYVEKEFENYINNFDKDRFEKGCKDFLEAVNEEESQFIQKLKCTIKKWEV
jgi:hypothetical protein